MTQASKTINVTNLGPIEELAVHLGAYGVTVLRAPNGAGKSIFLDAVHTLEKGKGKLPLRDQTKRGSVDAFGAHITIGASTRHSGDFEILSLEGRFDMAGLVDPKMKDPVAADRKRIKSLVQANGDPITAETFKTRPEFVDFDNVYPEYAAGECDELDDVTLVERVKRAYEARALTIEQQAKSEQAKAAALEEAASGIDVQQPHDDAELQAAVDAARSELEAKRAQLKNHTDITAKVATAKGNIQSLSESYKGPTLDQAESAVIKAEHDFGAARDAYEAAKAKYEAADRAKADAQKEMELARSHEAMKNELEIILDLVPPERPSDEDLIAASLTLETKTHELQQGAVVRKANEDLEKAKGYRVMSRQSEQLANRYRDAAGACVDVLSDAVKSDTFKVVHDGKASRVCVEHARGSATPYHELSPGEKWTLAIKEGASLVGEGGLLVIPQEAWEPIDGFTRPEIHREACERKVYVLTAEAQQDTTKGRKAVVESMGASA